MFKIPTLCALTLVLAACTAPHLRETVPEAIGSASPKPAETTSTTYHVDSGRSELRVLVYRAGPLARFGHNHVLVNRSIRGEVMRQAQSGTVSFSLTLPASAFSVDDARARAEEGADFSDVVADDAKAGTLHNMLSAAVLDADRFASISARGAGVPAQSAVDAVPVTVTVEIAVAGHTAKIDIPVQFKDGPAEMSVHGSLELKQSTLGLVPYSLMLGALQVQDAMILKFDLTAVRD